jgi:DNA-binding NarL/FixJ family response regulator
VVDIAIPPTPRSGRADNSQSVGLRLVRLLKQMEPTMGVVIFSAYDDRGAEVWQLVREGTRGLAYILKGSRPEELLTALTHAGAGEVFLSPDVGINRARWASDLSQSLTAEERPWIERALSRIQGLSDKELQVARRVAASHTNLSVAKALGISVKTVERHKNEVYKELGLADAEKESGLRKSMLLAKTCMIYELKQNSRA